MKYLKARLVEPGSIKMLVTVLLGVVGVVIAPEHLDAIAGGVAAVLAVIGVLTPEGKA